MLQICWFGRSNSRDAYQPTCPIENLLWSEFEHFCGTVVNIHIFYIEKINRKGKKEKETIPIRPKQRIESLCCCEIKPRR